MGRRNVVYWLWRLYRHLLGFILPSATSHLLYLNGRCWSDKLSGLHPICDAAHELITFYVGRDDFIARRVEKNSCTNFNDHLQKCYSRMAQNKGFFWKSLPPHMNCCCSKRKCKPVCLFQFSCHNITSIQFHIMNCGPANTNFFTTQCDSRMQCIWDTHCSCPISISMVPRGLAMVWLKCWTFPLSYF